MDVGLKSRKDGKGSKKLKDVSNKPVIGEDLNHLDNERAILTDSGENKRRRTIELKNKTKSWGFTLQTYAIQNVETKEIEVTTYVDYVMMGSPAWHAGIRNGDIIVAVNGESVENMTHEELVAIIDSCHDSMRLVVLFDDCCRRIELYKRLFRLKALLHIKQKQVRELDERDWCLRNGILYNPLRSSVNASICESIGSLYDLDLQCDLQDRDNGSKENLYLETEDSSSINNDNVFINDSAQVEVHVEISSASGISSSLFEPINFITESSKCSNELESYDSTDDINIISILKSSSVNRRDKTYYLPDESSSTQSYLFRRRYSIDELEPKSPVKLRSANSFHDKYPRNIKATSRLTEMRDRILHTRLSALNNISEKCPMKKIPAKTESLVRELQPDTNLHQYICSCKEILNVSEESTNECNTNLANQNYWKYNTNKLIPIEMSVQSDVYFDDSNIRLSTHM